MSARPVRYALFAATLAAMAAPSVGFAQLSRPSELPTTTRMMALGGNAQALAQSTSGTYSNPAAMSLGRVYHVDSSVLYDPSASRWAFGGTVVDSTRMVSAAVGYTYSMLDNDTEARKGHDIRVSLSVLLTEGIALGLTGRYMDLSTSRAAPRPMGSQAPRLGADYAGFTIDAGLILRPVSFLTVAVTGYSLTNPATATSPLSVGGGLAVTPIDNLNIVGDTVWDLNTFNSPRMRLSGGVELLVAHIPLRLGYLFDDTRLGGPAHTLTAGLGYIDTQFAVEASMRQDLAGGDQTSFLLNLRYFHRAM